MLPRVCVCVCCGVRRDALHSYLCRHHAVCGADARRGTGLVTLGVTLGVTLEVVLGVAILSIGLGL